VGQIDEVGLKVGLLYEGLLEGPVGLREVGGEDKGDAEVGGDVGKDGEAVGYLVG